MKSQDQLRASSDGLWGSMCLDQPLELMEFIGSQPKRTAGALMMQSAPRFLEKSPLLQVILFLQHFISFDLFLGKAS